MIVIVVKIALFLEMAADFADSWEEEKLFLSVPYPARAPRVTGKMVTVASMKSLLQSRLAWAVLPVLAALYWIALFVATHIPREFNILKHGRDKVIHFSAFAVLGLLVALSVNYWRRLSWRLTAAIIVVLAIYGAIDEYLQGVLTTQRKPDWKDWVMDAMGATAGAIAAAVLAKMTSKESSATDVTP